MKTVIVHLLLLLVVHTALSQSLRAGFNPSEFAEVLKINAQISEHPSLVHKIPLPNSRKVYSSEVVGLKNKWELWESTNHVGVIALRGSTMEMESWLSNFFAAQIPAKGKMTISKEQTFTYHVADHPKAAVHAGYVLSSQFLLQDIVTKIDSCYQKGLKEFIVTGHSQGGGLSYFVSASLLKMQKEGKLASDLRFKTYTSASPKPGNLYFAYEYEKLVEEGWSHHVINADDWVPQSPFTVQTLEDLPDVSPVMLLESALSKQSLLKKLFIKGIYKKITKPSKKAVKIYQKYLGKVMGKQIQKHYPGFVIPSFASSNEYVRTGRQIILAASDEAYYKQFDISKEPTQFMLHHSTLAYYYLLREQYKVD